MAVEHPSSREVVFHRLLDVRPEVAWRIWSDPEHLKHWFGPKGYTLTTTTFDFVPGGEWCFVMHSPDQPDNPNRIVFREIVPPSRLVYENSWDRPGAPLAFTAVVLFEPEGQRTRFSIRLTFSDDAAMQVAVERYGVIQGGEETLDRIAAYLSSCSQQQSP